MYYPWSSKSFPLGRCLGRVKGLDWFQCSPNAEAVRKTQGQGDQLSQFAWAWDGCPGCGTFSFKTGRFWANWNEFITLLEGFLGVWFINMLNKHLLCVKYSLSFQEPTMKKTVLGLVGLQSWRQMWTSVPPKKFCGSISIHSSFNSKHLCLWLTWNLNPGIGVKVSYTSNNHGDKLLWLVD